tara:strand:- start:636 stop:2108 length:1473 start_codon:yes stop_codon:yes gene_type:complete
MATDGFANLLWFLGVVEDRCDPRKMGRMRVRCFDIHPDDKNLVPTDDLPWAIPVLSNFNIDYKPPIEGSWVFGFFIDGRNAQHPIVIGVMPGMPTHEINLDKAFEPEHDVNPNPNDLGQPDINRLARGESIQQTIVSGRYINKEENEGYDWAEPDPPYNAEYPYNKVLETESGHVFEMDDTPGSERINLHHRTGTFTEVAPNGNQVNKIIGDSFTIVQQDDKILIKGNADVVIKGECTVNVEGNCDLTVDGDLAQTVHGDYSLDVAGSIKINAGNYFKLKSSSIRQEAYLESINLFAKVNINAQAINNVDITATNGTMKMFSKDTMLHQTENDYKVYVANDLHENTIKNKWIDVGGTYKINVVGEYDFKANDVYTQTMNDDAHIRYNDQSFFYYENDIWTEQKNKVVTDHSCPAPLRLSDIQCPIPPAVFTAEIDGNASNSEDITPAHRTLLDKPAERRFGTSRIFDKETYPIFTDPKAIDEDEHSREIE